MKIDDLKEECFVKWKADRTYNPWNTFGKVVKLTEDSVVIVTYDDLKETTLPKSSESIENEIELITKDEFDDLAKIEISKLNIEKTELEINFKNKLKKINAIIDELNEAL